MAICITPEQRLGEMSAFGISLCVMALLLGATASFEYNAYCQKLCLWGRGGNLCKCNAVHFVGKRAPGRASDLLLQVDRLPLSIRAAAPLMAGLASRHSSVGGTSGTSGLGVVGLLHSGGGTITDTAAAMKSLGGKTEDQAMLNDIRRRLRRFELGKNNHRKHLVSDANLGQRP